MVKKILVASDGSDHAEKALDLAAKLATGLDAKLKVVHVMMRGHPPDHFMRMAEAEHLYDVARGASAGLDNVPANLMGVMHAARENQNVDRVLAVLADTIVERAKSKAKDAGVKDIKTEVLDGDPATAIIKAARDWGADMIVTGSRGLGDLKGLLVGSVSHKIAHHADCTCVAVK